MDYHRIYREFIADRKRRELSLIGYTEKHHILPRSLGGTDDSTNLIRLTPEDHFFAHLLIAKAHNTMPTWGAVMVMHERASRSTIFWRKSRERYAWARRRYSEFCTAERLGLSNPNYKPDVVILKHITHGLTERTRFEWNTSGVPHSALCGLLAGKSRSYKGWMLPGTCPKTTGRSYAGIRKRINTVHEWVNIDGRSEVASVYSLAELHGLRANDLTAVVRGAHSMCYGWSIKGRDTGWPCGRQHFKDERVHTLVNRDGRSAKGTQMELARQIGLNQRDVSALIRGARMSSYGWMRRDTAESGHEPREWTRRAVGTRT